ncbi:MAG: glycoside hydrolase family 16 protein [Bacteroidota bacterium]
MRYLLFCAALLITISACSKTEEQPEEEKYFGPEEVEWELVWEDNFDTDGLPDNNIWDYEEGYIRNNEAQYYTKERLENARVEDGNLVIEARKDNWNEHEITSASLHTYGKKSMLYGKIEVRAKLPTGKGTWPAIWMLGNSIRNGTGWPECGEIDIMENVGYDPNVIHANIHTKAYNHGIGTNKGDKMTVEKPYKEFHTYTVEWFEHKLAFFIDDTLYFTFYNENSGNDTWPFDKAHYLIINLAIGGAWGGQQGIDDNIFPQKYYIDYVKVYKQK